MSKEWQPILLGDYVRFQKGVSYQGKHLDQPGPGLLGLGTIVPGGGVKLDAARTYSGRIRDRQRIGPGELLVALTDLTQDGKILGSPAFVPLDAEGDYAVTHHVGRVEVVEPDQIDTRFLFYLLQTPEYFAYMRGVATGTTVRAVSPKDAERYDAEIPPLPEQRRIAAVLGALDDKIELNRRMNRTLEALAQALFRRQFVAFDGHDRLVDSGTDLGEIPEGWEVGPLSRLASLRTRMVQPQDAPETEWEHFSIPAYDAGERPSMERGDTIMSGKYRVPDAAVLASKLNPRFPRVWMPDVKHPNEAICSTEFMPFVPRRPEWRSFLYSMMWSEPFQRAIQTRATGTTPSRQRVRPPVIAQMPVLIPPPDVIDQFSEAAGPLQERRLANLRENDTLAALRDALLPELISGRLRVPEGALSTEPA